MTQHYLKSILSEKVVKLKNPGIKNNLACVFKNLAKYKLSLVIF